MVDDGSSEDCVWDLLLRNVRGGFFGGTGLLSPTSVKVATSCVVVRGREDDDDDGI